MSMNKMENMVDKNVDKFDNMEEKTYQKDKVLDN
jgi:hypothetical protein